MSRPPLISRRLLLTGFWLAGTALARAQVKRGDDHGIGGTGITRGDDHGIGGTGIVGVIQRFGSIYVNGERVTYASDVPVRIDGEAASPKALRIGQLARVVAMRQADGTLVTRNIAIASEVSGADRAGQGQRADGPRPEDRGWQGQQAPPRHGGGRVWSAPDRRRDRRKSGRAAPYHHRTCDGSGRARARWFAYRRVEACWRRPAAGRPARPDRGQHQPGRDAGRAHPHRRFFRISSVRAACRSRPMCSAQARACNSARGSSRVTARALVRQRVKHAWWSTACSIVRAVCRWIRPRRLARDQVRLSPAAARPRGRPAVRSCIRIAARRRQAIASPAHQARRPRRDRIPVAIPAQRRQDQAVRQAPAVRQVPAVLARPVETRWAPAAAWVVVASVVPEAGWAVVGAEGARVL